jgi:hypothetical protein
LIKVVRATRVNWGLTVRITRDPIAAAKYALDGQGMLQQLLLRSSIGDRTIEFAPRGVRADVELHVKVVMNGEVVSDKVLKPGQRVMTLPPTAGEGIYLAQVIIGTDVFSEAFIVGTPEECREAILSQANNDAKSAQRDNILALDRRLKILFQPTNRKFASESARRDWERKVVWTMTELQNIVRHWPSNLAQTESPGLHLRAFTSKIDSSCQHYRLFVPSIASAPERKLPLIIMLPTVTSTARPFIESAFMAAHSEAERISAIAERLGVAVVWSGYRRPLVGAAEEYAHIKEVVDDVMLHANIDSSRIAMMGACSAGAVATRAVLHHLGRYSAIGLLNPMFGLDRGIAANVAQIFGKSESFISWMSQTDVVSDFLARANVPIYMIHDGAEPGHGDLSVALRFEQLARSKQYPLLFERTSQTLHQHFGAWERLMTWLVKQHREQSPGDSIGMRREDGFSGFFQREFVVVVGTGGSSLERSKMKEIGDKWQAQWRAVHFGDCVLMTDVEFEQKASETVQLVLIGNSERNAVWRRLEPKLNVALGVESLRLGTQIWRGRNLGIEAMGRVNGSNRQVLLIGGCDIADARMPVFDLSSAGWCDYAIWSADGLLMAAGMQAQGD